MSKLKLEIEMDEKLLELMLDVYENSFERSNTDGTEDRPYAMVSQMIDNYIYEHYDTNEYFAHLFYSENLKVRVLK